MRVKHVPRTGWLLASVQNVSAAPGRNEEVYHAPCTRSACVGGGRHRLLVDEGGGRVQSLGELQGIPHLCLDIPTAGSRTGAGGTRPESEGSRGQQHRPGSGREGT